jgi:hypothetical protein
MLAAFFFYNCFRPIPAGAQTFVEITADIELHFASLPQEYKWSVDCIVGTNLWKISVGTEGGVQWLFDGSELEEKLVDLHQDSPAYRHYTIDVYPSSDGYPLADMGANLPWLAFCSGAYLKKEGRIIPFPLSPLPNAPDGFAYSDKTATFKDGLGLPRVVDFFTSEALFKSSIMGPFFLGLHDVEYWKCGGMGYKFGGIPDGRLKFHYSVAATTNFMGWTFPAEFQFFENDLTTNGTWTSHCSGSGRMRSLRVARQPTVADLDDGRLHTILDWRFVDKRTGLSGLPYETTNSDISTTNDLELQKKFAARIARAHFPRVTAGRTRILFAVFCLLSALLPLASIYRKKQKVQ